MGIWRQNITRRLWFRAWWAFGGLRRALRGRPLAQRNQWRRCRTVALNSICGWAAAPVALAFASYQAAFSYSRRGGCIGERRNRVARGGQPWAAAGVNGQPAAVG